MPDPMKFQNAAIATGLLLGFISLSWPAMWLLYQTPTDWRMLPYVFTVLFGSIYAWLMMAYFIAWGLHTVARSADNGRGDAGG